jgi:cytochrome c2
MRAWILAAVVAAAPMGGAMAQDAEAGARVFNQCRACHTINAGGRNGVGPNLHGVWDRRAAANETFRYSAPMREKAAGWPDLERGELPRLHCRPEGRGPGRLDVLPRAAQRAAAERPRRLRAAGFDGAVADLGRRLHRFDASVEAGSALRQQRY